MDLRRQKAVQLFKYGAVKKLDNGSFAVKSQSSKKYYFVDEAFTCTCPDCQTKQLTCKHAFAVKYFLGIEKADGTVEKVKLTYRQAWRAYNQAQNNEVNYFDKLLSNLLEVVE